MKRITAVAVPIALFAGCTCGETHSLPDASFDAPGLDVAIDAFTPPPFEPTLVWRAEGAGMCPEIMTPVWDPPPEPPIARGQQRWSNDRRPLYPEVAPTLLADGTSFWATDLSRDQVLNYLTGSLDDGFPIGTPIPREMLDTEFRYRLPRMTLGRNTIVIRDLWSLRRMQWGPGGSALRSWTFPVLDELFAAERAMPLPDMRFGRVEQTMPAWNPVTGQLAFTVGLENQILAVQCPGDDMGQFILDIGARNELAVGSNPYTQIFYRENGELILHRNGQTHIISPTGEVLRTLEMGPYPRPHAYDQTCGVLYNVGDYLWQWWNVDTMLGGPILQLRQGDSFVSGSEDCGIIESDPGRILVIHPDNTESRIYATPGFQIVGGWARYSEPRARVVEILDSRGEVRESIRTENDITSGVLTPDGNVLSSNARWYLGFPPAPWLTLNSGLNWAHTNSPLPE